MNYRPNSFSVLPEVIKNLLIINGLFFVATLSLGQAFDIDLSKILGLYLPGSPFFKPYQLVSHMFMHGGFTHLFFNMFALWMFGTSLENYWGPKKFLMYYMITGLGAACLHLGVNYWEALQLKAILTESQNYISQNAAESAYNLKYTIPTVGASGAVFGVLLAFGMTFPNQRIYLYFAIPIKAKYFVMAYGALELYNGLQNDPSSNIAHFAHLGGMLFGYLLIKLWDKKHYTGY